MKNHSFLRECAVENYMRKYTAKDEEELIKQIESDTGLDSELEHQEFVKGHVVEIRYRQFLSNAPKR